MEEINKSSKTSLSGKIYKGCFVVVASIVAIISIVYIAGSDCGSGKNADDSSDYIPIEVDSTEIKRQDSIEKAEEVAFLQSKAGRIWKKHPEWSKEDCKLLAKNKIWIGMHVDMIKYLRGLPNKVNVSNYGYGNEYQACWDNYTPSYFYYGEDGIITAYN